MAETFTSDPENIAECSEAQRAFVLENFRALREEIVSRVGHHQRLMWGKIVALGLFTSFLLTSLPDETLRVIGFALLPGLAIVFDFLVGKNIRAIHCLGIFIRDRLERDMYATPMWESSSGQSEARVGVRNYGPIDAAVLGVTSAVVLLLSAGMVLRDEGWPAAAGAAALWLVVFAVTIYKVVKMVDYRDGDQMDAIDRLVGRASRTMTSR